MFYMDHANTCVGRTYAPLPLFRATSVRLALPTPTAPATKHQQPQFTQVQLHAGQLHSLGVSTVPAPASSFQLHTTIKAG